ncbi:Gfo/Idh/MocA family oxidoreductase [Tabrizicola sp.]|uniref:Gfo/Idh/MocA family protein n=1 Tax=Tabrizicola sp. TaxID=2005166 RepID=UPI00286A12B6|nr:Gfo/Idh/MocA family oxidoreductase [Tabrizicola sp.]
MAGGVTVLVVGAGSIGRRHHENLMALGAQSHLIGWRGFSAQALAARLAEGADAVVIATATDVRLPLVKACAAAGVPFYVEKPLAFRPADVETIAVLAAPVAQRSMLGMMMRYHPAFRELAATDLSDVFQFALSIGHDVTQWRANWRFSQSYAAKADGGGVLLDLCHEVDMAACLFPGLSVHAVESLGHVAYPGVDMASRISLGRTGLSGDVAMDYLTPKLHRHCILRGSERMHDFDFASQHYVVTDAAGPAALHKPLDRNEMFLAAMRDFLALVAGRVVSDIEHLPRLDLCLPSARLVAGAWAARVFNGQIRKEIP